MSVISLSIPFSVQADIMTLSPNAVARLLVSHATTLNRDSLYQDAVAIVFKDHESLNIFVENVTLELLRHQVVAARLP